MKDGGLGESLLCPPSHLEKPVLNGLSDLLRLPQYPVLGVRAAASAGVRREGELYAPVRAGASVGASVHETHTNRGILFIGDRLFRGRPGLGRKPHGPRQKAGLRRPWTRGDQAAAACGTSARGRRRCDIPRPSRAHALLRRPPPRKRGQRARPADDRAFPAREARAVSRSGHRHQGLPAGRAKPSP